MTSCGAGHVIWNTHSSLRGVFAMGNLDDSDFSDTYSICQFLLKM